MSISSIIGTTPNQVPWAKLSANSLNCNSITASINLSPSSVALFQLPAPGPTTLAIGSDDEDVTNEGVTFNLAVPTVTNGELSASGYNGNPASIYQGAPTFINIASAGVYDIAINFNNVTITNPTEASGNMIMQLKIQPSVGPEIVIPSTQVSIDGTNKTFSITKRVILSNTIATLQVNFKRTADAAASSPEGAITIPKIDTNFISITRIA